MSSARRQLVRLALASLMADALVAVAAAQGDRPFQNAGEVRAAAAEVLSRPEFARLRRQLQRDEPAAAEPAPQPPIKPPASSWRSFRLPRLGGLFEALGAMFHGVAWLLLVVMCGLIVLLLARAVTSWSGRSGDARDQSSPLLGEEVEGHAAPGDLPADVYLRRAAELARQARYREAIAQLLAAAMSHLERAGLIRHRNGLTFGDYLRAAGQRPPHFDALRSMVRVYEPLSFGRRAATADHFQTSLANYESGFSAAAWPSND